MCARAKSQETIVMTKKRQFHFWISNSTMNKQKTSHFSFITDRQVRDHLVIFCLLLHICKSSTLPAWWQNVVDRKRRKKTFSLHNIANVILHTWRIHKLFDHFYFSSLQTSGIDRISIRYIYTLFFSLWLAHILLTFLSLNLVKRTLIEL